MPGSIIVSDGWRAYHNLEEIGGGVYEHKVVIIHEENFVDPEDPEVHTQNIENTWMRCKRKLRRQFGTSTNLFVKLGLYVLKNEGNMRIYRHAFYLEMH
jgi:hypothetical protein